jgi:hypothetical protein
VEISHPDYRTVQTNINVVPGQVYIVVVEMSQGAFLGFLNVKTDVPGAAVFVDNRSEGQVGQTPWGNVLPTGKHIVWVEKPGYKLVKQALDIALGEEFNLELTLERLSFGTLLVKTNTPLARIFLDEKPLGEAPLEEQVPPGRHTLKVTAEGLKDYVTEVTVARGQQTKVLVRMNAKPNRTSAWVSLGFSAALLAGGGTMGIIALGLQNDLESERNAGRLADNDPRVLTGFLLALGADVSFGLGAVVGALCIYYFLRDPLPPSAGKLHDPTDFTESPENIELAGDEGPDENPAEAKEAKPPINLAPKEKTEARTRPMFLVTPILNAETAGLGLTVVF